jgi:hypothetical protein
MSCGIRPHHGTRYRTSKLWRSFNGKLNVVWHQRGDGIDVLLGGVVVKTDSDGLCREARPRLNAIFAKWMLQSAACSKSVKTSTRLHSKFLLKFLRLLLNFSVSRQTSTHISQSQPLNSTKLFPQKYSLDSLKIFR